MGRGGLERGHREGRSDNCNGMYKMAGMGWGEGVWKEAIGKGGVPIVTVCIRLLGMGWEEGVWKEAIGKGGVPIVTVCTRWTDYRWGNGAGKRSRGRELRQLVRYL